MIPVSVVETSVFQRLVPSYWTEDEAGDLIVGTGGARKVRWMRGGMGKRGAVRTIHYFHAVNWPIVLITIYGKGDKETLSAADKREIRQLIDDIQRSHRHTEDRRRQGAPPKHRR